jgi:guanylate kinase
MPSLLLICGPSGVGKSTIIDRLCLRDDRFVYIQPYMTRQLRNGETNKIFISDEGLNSLIKEEKILVVNELFGYRYATPREPIDMALLNNQFPLVDWLIYKVAPLKGVYNSRLFCVYLEPPDEQTLLSRLNDGRGDINKRFSAAQEELSQLRAGRYDSQIDLRIVNRTGAIDDVVSNIYQEYLKTIT